ncbi:hypothetical protein ACWD25_28110 [Streptomyces sp. NPDC002920]
MRAHDERPPTSEEPSRPRRTVQPDPSAVVALAALQRTAGNAAVVRLLGVQRMPDAVRGHRARRKAVADSPYSRRPQSARQQEQQGFDPAVPRAAQLPAQGPGGAAIWRGTRSDIGFTKETTNAVFANTPSQNANGRTEYQCAKCNAFIPRKRDRTPADGDRFVAIDHISGIIAYVQTNATEVTWAVGGRTVAAITRDEAKRCANDPANLRVLCAQPCNGGTRAAQSASRRYDTDRAVRWVG